MNYINYDAEIRILFSIVIKYLKVKGDMLVMENISRKKNKSDFEKLEIVINEYQREHSK